MKIQRAYKYELMPNGEAVCMFVRFAGAKRFVWNKVLRDYEKYPGYVKAANLLPQWKVEFPWMREAHSQVLQQALKDLDRGWKNFFEKRAERPVPKKKGKSIDSFRFPQGFKLEEGNNRIYLPKIGWVRYRNSRAMRGVAKNITISSSGNKWFASIQVEYEAEPPVPIEHNPVGIDLGIARFASLSDGSHVDPLNALKKRQYRLRRYQRMMARKQKFSQNWMKAKAKVQAEYKRIGDARKDYLHKASTQIVKNHDLICIEDLQVANMTKSAAGTAAAPGRNVKQKSGMNRSILDQGWYSFRLMLEYKSAWAGGRVIAVPAMYTSQTCPECGYVSKLNRKTQAEFLCVKCGYSANADYVGSRNILAAGLAVFEGSALDLACGGEVEVRLPMKQEPTEAAA